MEGCPNSLIKDNKVIVIIIIFVKTKLGDWQGWLGLWHITLDSSILIRNC